MKTKKIVVLAIVIVVVWCGFEFTLSKTGPAESPLHRAGGFPAGNDAPVRFYSTIEKSQTPAGEAFIGYDDDTDLILVLSTQGPPPPPNDKQLRLCLYDGKLTITCGENVEMDEASEVFFNEILKPMVDMYIKDGMTIKVSGGE